VLQSLMEFTSPVTRQAGSDDLREANVGGVTSLLSASSSSPSKKRCLSVYLGFSCGECHGFSHHVLLAPTAYSTRPSYRSHDLAGLRRALWTDDVEDLLGGSQT